MVIPSSVLGAAWIAALGRDGVLTHAIRWLAGDGRLTVYRLPIAAAVVGLRFLGPASLVLLHERLRQNATWPAERVLGVSSWRTFLHLRCRAAWGPGVLAFFLVFLLTANEHILPGLFLFSTYGTQLLIQYSALLDPAGAAALAVPPALVMAGLAVLLLWWAWAWTDDDNVLTRLPPPAPRWHSVVAVLIGIFVLAAAVGIPVAVLVVRGGSWSAMTDAFLAARQEALTTLTLLLVAAPLCTIISAVLAAHWVRARDVARTSPAPAILLNLMVPASLLAIGCIHLSQRLPTAWLDSDGPLILGLLARTVPLITLVLFALWRQEPPLTGHAARLHGIKPWRRWVALHWPSRRRSLLAALFLAMILMATELEVSLLLAQPGRSTLGVRLYTLIHTAPDRMVNALALDILLCLVPAIAAAWCFRTPRTQTMTPST